MLVFVCFLQKLSKVLFDIRFLFYFISYVLYSCTPVCLSRLLYLGRP